MSNLSIGCNVSYEDSGTVNVSGDYLADCVFPSEITQMLERLTHGIEDFIIRRVPGMIDPQKASFSCFFNGDVFTELKQLQLDRSEKVWTYSTPEADGYQVTVSFGAIVTKCEPNFSDIAGLSKMDVDLDLTGNSISYNGES